MPQDATIEVVNEAEGTVYVFANADDEQAHALTGEPTYQSVRPITDEDRALVRQALADGEL